MPDAWMDPHLQSTSIKELKLISLYYFCKEEDFVKEKPKLRLSNNAINEVKLCWVVPIFGLNSWKVRVIYPLTLLRIRFRIGLNLSLPIAMVPYIKDTEPNQ